MTDRVAIFSARDFFRGYHVDEVFDEAELLQTVQGDRELLGELGRLFAGEAPGHVEAVRKAIQQNDAHALKFAAHTLKGSAATLTARRVAEQAHALEKIGAGGTIDGAEERLKALEDAMAELGKRLHAVEGY